MPRSPSRRAFGALAVAALAGCLDSSNGDSNADTAPETDSEAPGEESNDSEAPSEESIESPDPYPDVAIATDPIPDKAGLGVSVTPTEPFTGESPARIRFDMTNLGEETREYEFAFSPPYSPNYARNNGDGAALLVLPDDQRHVVWSDELPDDREVIRRGNNPDFAPEEPTDGCWRSRSGYGANDILRHETLAPGETLSGGYTLLADVDGDCLTPGTYRTEREWNPVDENWGFEITLSE